MYSERFLHELVKDPPNVADDDVGADVQVSVTVSLSLRHGKKTGLLHIR